MVLITGAARRVGAEMVRHLHQAGLNIVIHYRSSSKDASALAEQLNAQRSNSIKLLKGDLKDYQSIPKLVADGINTFGRIDALINNASSFYPTDIKEVNEEVWEDLVGVNLKAPMYLTQSLATELKKNKGCIVNIVDIHGDRPLKGYSIYSIAKAGLIMLTKSMARELAPDIRVNGIAPGAIMWPEEQHYEGIHQAIIERTALKREGHPKDIAETALFLIEKAGYITGQIIAVDGGRTLSN
ncbi:MAG: pteridine reductase [Pseudomonadota bacterium]